MLSIVIERQAYAQHTRVIKNKNKLDIIDKWRKEMYNMEQSSRVAWHNYKDLNINNIGEDSG